MGESHTGTSSTGTLKRDDWMMGGRGDTSGSASSSMQAADPLDEASYFSSLGKARIKAPRPEKPDPEKLKISSRELNTQLLQGKSVDEYDTPTNSDTRPQFGAPDISGA